MENGQEDYTRNALASKLTVACWIRKESLGPVNPGHQQSGAVGETCMVCPAELTDWDLGYGKLQFEGVEVDGEGARARVELLSKHATFCPAELT